MNLQNGLLITALSKVMVDGNAPHHASHSNLAGANAIMSVATIGADRAAMRMQKPLGSTDPLGLGPRFLVVPAALETDGQKLVTDIQAVITSDANPFGGKLEVVADPRLTGTSWYLFADPALWPVLKFATLVG